MPPEGSLYLTHALQTKLQLPLVLISATIHPLHDYGCIASKISKTIL
jgi:hypothetical protein